MAMVDAFTPSPFRLNNMMVAITKAPYQPGQLQASGLWTSGPGLTTTIAVIELRNGVLDIVGVTPRGGQGQEVNQRTYQSVPVQVPHMQEQAEVFADEVLNAKQFGTESGNEILSTRRDELIGWMKNNLVYTDESHKMHNLSGNFMDKNGDVFSTYTLFGLTPPAVVPIDLSAPANANIRKEALNVQTQIEDSLGGSSFTGLDVWCGKDLWEGLIVNESIEKTFLNQQEAAERRGSVLNSFVVNEMRFIRYRGDSKVFIPPKEAKIVPTGVPNFFMERDAPADYNETVGRPGLSFNAKTAVKKFDKGYDMEAQKNTINIPTRPEALRTWVTP